MFKAVRITILLFVLFMVAVGTWLTQARSTDWNNSLWVKIYPINGDGSAEVARYISSLEPGTFAGIESFVAREVERYGRQVDRPVRIELGDEIKEQPPAIGTDPNMLDVVFWSLSVRYWASRVGGLQDMVDPDVRIFVRYHEPQIGTALDDSVGLRKGMVGIVNAHASQRRAGRNNVVIAHEFLHTLGASDKYNLATGQPTPPDGLAEPDRRPLYPQRFAEIMGGRVALTGTDAQVPQSLRRVLIGPATAAEIRLID